MNWRRTKKFSWILLVPLVIFAVASWVFLSGKTELRVSGDRARELWREERFEESIEAFLALREQYPRTPEAARALWEVATIYYYNLYDISNALHYFEQLIREYPESEWAAESHMRLADIFEIELNEEVNAWRHLESALERQSEGPEANQIRFRIADLHFKMGQIERAMAEYAALSGDADSDKHLAHRSRIRVGTLHQIRHEHERAIEIFTRVLKDEPCPDCRLRAQLGLIESYEYLDRLEEAIEMASRIREEAYPLEMKDKLLQRLTEKRRYYEPRLWVEPD